MSKYVGYVRNAGFKCEKQVDEILGYASKNKYIVTSLYMDINVSGNNRDRKKLNLMLDELEAGDVVIIHNVSRLSRNIKTYLELEKIIKEKGATIEYVTQP